jgi:hypothetical protein
VFERLGEPTTGGYSHIQAVPPDRGSAQPSSPVVGSVNIFTGGQQSFGRLIPGLGQYCPGTERQNTPPAGQQPDWRWQTQLPELHTATSHSPHVAGAVSGQQPCCATQEPPGHFFSGAQQPEREMQALPHFFWLGQQSVGPTQAKPMGVSGSEQYFSPGQHVPRWGQNPSSQGRSSVATHSPSKQ